MRNAFLFLLSLTALPAAGAAASGAQPEEPIIGNPTVAVSVLEMEALTIGLSGPQKYKLFTNPAQVQRVAESLLVTEMLATEARQMGLADQELHRAVTAQKVDEYLASVRIKALNAEPVPDMSEAAKERYLADPEAYSTPTLVRVSHILSRFKKRTGELRPKEDARATIAAVRERVLAGEDFEAIAIEVSEDPSVKRNRGDLGFLGRGKMVKSFEDAAFALTKPGQISDVVETSFGFHVLKLLERKDGELKPFDQVRDQIVSVLEGKYRRQRREDYVDKIKTESGVVLYEDVFDDYLNERRAQLGIGEETGEDAEAAADSR